MANDDIMVAIVNRNERIILMETNTIGNFRKDFNEKLLCPRCGLTLLPITYPGARSRRDNKTEICSRCGTEEGLLDFANVPDDMSTWFVNGGPIRIR